MNINKKILVLWHIKYLPQKKESETYILNTTIEYLPKGRLKAKYSRTIVELSTNFPIQNPKSPIPKTPMLTPPTKTTLAIERENS